MRRKSYKSLSNDSEKIDSTIGSSKCWLPSYMNMRVLYAYGLLSGFRFDFADYAIIAWCIEFMKSENMVKNKFISQTTGRSETSYWVNYRGIMDQLALLNMSVTRAVAERMRSYSDAGIMEHFTDKNQSGTFSYFRFYEEPLKLLTSRELDAYREVLFSPEERSKLPSYSEVSAEELKITCKEPKILCEESKLFCEESKIPPKYSEVINSKGINSDVITLSESPSEFRKKTEEYINDLFKEKSNCFSPDLSQKVESNFSMRKMDESKLYGFIKYVFDISKTKCRDESKRLSYFYKCVTNPKTIDSFLCNEPAFYDQKKLSADIPSLFG